MAEHVVVDAGPLVEMLRQDDHHHLVCRDAAQQLRPPFVTTWLAITEAGWLLRNVSGGVESLVGFLESKLVHCHNLDDAFVPWLKAFLNQYADLRPQVADASLVYVADTLQSSVVFTLDRRDFSVFRNRLGHPFRLFPESFSDHG
jgi:predicted nucleic acid-binding protein